MNHPPSDNQPIILPNSVSLKESLQEHYSEEKAAEIHARIYKQIRSNSQFPEPTGEKGMDLYVERISWMNDTFQLENNALPTNLGVVRLLKFYKTILNEVTELLECVNNEGFKDHILSNDPNLTNFKEPDYIENIVSQYEAQHDVKLKVNMVALADTLVDLNVYDTSEMVRWGIPIEECLHAVMESQVTKLDTNGLPVKSPDNAKFLKGPYYIPPEPEIQEILDALTYE